MSLSSSLSTKVIGPNRWKLVCIIFNLAFSSECPYHLRLRINEKNFMFYFKCFCDLICMMLMMGFGLKTILVWSKLCCTVFPDRHNAIRTGPFVGAWMTAAKFYLEQNNRLIKIPDITVASAMLLTSRFRPLQWYMSKIIAKITLCFFVTDTYLY